MKKLILLFGAVAILFAACSDMFGGSDGDNESDGVRDKIESAKDGDTISMRDYDDEASIYTVTAKNLTLLDAKMPNTTIVVSEEIGEDSFTLKNCVFKSLEIRGGGSNSVHIEGGEITKVIAKKENVRIKLEKGATVTDLNIEVNCTLDADDDGNNAVATISISKTVTEFKIGAENSEKSIAISITHIETGSTVNSDFKITVKNPEIVKNTEFSSDIKDKVVDTDKKPVEVKTDGYEKLPLKTQEKSVRFPADSDNWGKDITIESKENEEVFLIKNTNPVSENVYDVGTRIKMPYEGKKGKSYSIKFDLKADKDCYANVKVEDRLFNFENPTIWCNLSQEWQSFELYTGKLYEDWSEFRTLTIAMGNASEVEIKNLRIKEDENLCIPTSIYYSKGKFVDDIIEVKSYENSVELTSSEPKHDNPDAPYGISGVNIIFGVLEANNLYKVTFDVTPDANGNFMTVWGHAAEDAYDTGGNSHFSFEKGVKKTITLYIPCYALSYVVVDKDGKQIDKGNREKSIGCIWICSFDGNKHTITVENIRSEVVENIETIKAKDNLDFYVERYVTDKGIDSATGEVNSAWLGYEYLDNHNDYDDTILMPGYGIYFDYIMSDGDCWGSTKTTITAFRYNDDNSFVIKKNPDGYNKPYYENEETYPVALHFGLDDKWRVTVEAKNATERVAQVEQESAWYYFEFDPSESEWSNFKNDRSQIWFSIQYNYGKNNSYGFGFPDGQNVIYKDSWAYWGLKEGETWCPYGVSDSERDDKPRYESTDGKLRIYFYTGLSKLCSSPNLIPALRNKTPYVHVWDGIAEKDIDESNGWGWQMTKVE